MSTSTRIAVIGAGNVGGNLGVRFSKAGFPVQFGMRAGSAKQSPLERCGEGATVAEPAAAAAWGDVVFLAVPGSVAVEVARSLAATLEGKVVVDCNNSLTW